MAKKFHFRLDVVERVRRQARDAAQRAVAQAERAVTRVEQHLSAVRGQLGHSADATATTLGVATLNVPLVRVQEFHRGWLHRQMMMTQQTLEQRRRELSIRRQALVESTKQLRVIEKLREKQWRRHQVAVNREEQSVSDELALARHVRSTLHPTRRGTA